jgi:hypothetical protein
VIAGGGGGAVAALLLGAVVLVGLAVTGHLVGRRVSAGRVLAAGVAVAAGFGLWRLLVGPVDPAGGVLVPACVLLEPACPDRTGVLPRPTGTR